MKKIFSRTDYVPLSYKEGEGFREIEKNNGEIIKFKTRKAVENFCLKNKCAYTERKYICYR